MKPFKHAESSVKKYGGVVEDYLPIHNWFDATKSSCGDNRHRCLRHHSEGIFWCEDKFGVNITNSDNKLVSVRDLGEQHVIEDLGFIPTVSDYLCELNIRDWMCGDKKDRPESRKFTDKKTLKEALTIKDILGLEDDDVEIIPMPITEREDNLPNFRRPRHIPNNITVD